MKIDYEYVLGFLTSVAIIIFILLIYLGGVITTHNSIRNDCETFGAFVSSNNVKYECVRVDFDEITGISKSTHDK